MHKLTDYELTGRDWHPTNETSRLADRPSHGKCKLHLRTAKGFTRCGRSSESAWGERVYFYYILRLLPEILGTDMLNFAVALAAEGVYDINYIRTPAG